MIGFFTELGLRLGFGLGPVAFYLGGLALPAFFFEPCQADTEKNNYLLVTTVCEQYIVQMQDFFSKKMLLSEMLLYDGGMKREKPSEVGERITELRQEKGLTQRQLAERLGQPQSNVAYWERRAPAPPGEVLADLARILDVSVDALLGVRPVRRKPSVIKGSLQQVFERVSQLPRRQQAKVVEFVEAFVEKKVAQ